MQPTLRPLPVASLPDDQVQMSLGVAMYELANAQRRIDVLSSELRRRGLPVPKIQNGDGATNVTNFF
jgi:hypothetical protein